MATKKVAPRTLSGFMELLPAPQRQMERIMEILRETYSLYGSPPRVPCRIHRRLSPAKSCLPKAAVKQKSRSTAFRRAMRI